MTLSRCPTKGCPWRLTEHGRCPDHGRSEADDNNATFNEIRALMRQRKAKAKSTHGMTDSL